MSKKERIQEGQTPQGLPLTPEDFQKGLTPSPPPKPPSQPPPKPQPPKK